jgi:hypothetical protein
MSFKFARKEPEFRIAVVVLNYRTPDLALQAAQSAAESVDAKKDLVLIVDNASPDDSADQIQAGIERLQLSHIRLVRSPENGGFAAGNNVGIRAVAAQAYVLLNSDTIVRPGAMEILFAALLDNPRVGIVSPRLQYDNDEPQISCFRHHTVFSELMNGAQTGPVSKLLNRWDVGAIGVRDEPCAVPWTSFACVMIRREVFEQVGLLDEGFFMYYEDADYCRLVGKAGFLIFHDPRARVVHLRGKSSPVKEAGRLGKRRPGYYYAARGRYFRRAYGDWGAALANTMWSIGRLVALPRELVGNKKKHTVEYEFVDKWRDTFDQGPRRP